MLAQQSSLVPAVPREVATREPQFTRLHEEGQTDGIVWYAIPPKPLADEFTRLSVVARVVSAVFYGAWPAPHDS